MFGLEFAQSDTVQLYVSGNGSFLINTPSLLCVGRWVFTELDKYLTGASVGYRFVESVSDPMIPRPLRFRIHRPTRRSNFVCFELQYHFADRAFDILTWSKLWREHTHHQQPRGSTLCRHLLGKC
ncbi:MAG: hypothetical protein IPM83_16750 [Ignavibacteria bacterium]|nr:hypothetical protein [Ignavibacteria bacterium]